MKTTYGINSALLAGLVGLGCGQAPSPDPSGVDDPGPIEVKQGATISNCAWGNSQMIRVADYSGDGIKDVVSPNGNRIDRYQSTGTFSYTFVDSPSFGTYPWGGADYTWAGNFDGAGGDDIASAVGGNVYVKLMGAQINQTWTVTNSWGAAGFTFAADFAGDGKTDIATGFGNTINLFMKDPSVNRMNMTTSHRPTGSYTWGGAANPFTHAGYTQAADFTGDGKADIASAVGGTVYMKVSNGAGGFTEWFWNVENSWGGGDFTFAGDFNGDGKADIASASGSNVYMKISTGSSFFQGTNTWTVDNLWGGSDYTWVADFNGDGKADIASASGGNIYVKMSTGTGFISRTLSVANSWGTSDMTKVGDFTGDGRADIVTFVGCNGSLHEIVDNGVNQWRIVTHPL